MIAQPSQVNDQRVQDALRVTRPTTSPTMRTAYRLYVIASDVVDVVRAAGGWLFDRVMAGWAVNVLLPDGCNVRPLQVLGVSPVNADAGLQSMTNGPQAQSLAVAVDVFTSEASVREDVVSALDRGLTEVTLWGDNLPADIHRRLDHVQHRLSAAARVFKVQALVAAGVSPDSVGPAEPFLSGARWYPPEDSDLLPVS